MATVRYLGNFDVLSDGKLLFEILAQLRNYGIGRMVYKKEWLRRWPEQPSYCIVRNVKPKMDRWLWKGSMHADFVYRGKPVGLFLFDADLHLADWSLVHKHEEKEFAKCERPFETRTLPKKLPLPPLMRHIREVEAKREGVPLDSLDLRMINRPLFDDEHAFLKKYTQLVDKKNPPINSDIYEQNPQNYLDLYGQQLPCKVDYCVTDKVDND